MNDIDIFVPSYHRPDNIKTLKYLKEIGYDTSKIHIFIDSEADDKEAYEETVKKAGAQLHIFDMAEARRRYDYVHLAPQSRRSAGQARNMFYDFAKDNGIDFYIVIDDDTVCFQLRAYNVFVEKITNADVLRYQFAAIKDFMIRRHIGVWGLSQTGELLNRYEVKLLRWKVMNTTFINTKYVYRGEKGVQDDDTSFFTGVYNEGFLTASFRSGIVLNQTVSATSKGGLTELYEEQKLFNKAMVCPIQYPSAIWAERQKMNGNRIHHHINGRYIRPMLIRGNANNLAWDTYPEDVPFTNEPKRVFDLKR